MTKNPNLTKPGWHVWRFDQMATNVNVRIDNPSESGMDHYVGLEHLDTDSLRIRRWGSPDEVEATKLLFKKGDIIFGRRRAYQRKLGIAEFDGICSAHAMVLRAKPEVVLPEFLPFFMQSDLFISRAVEISVGSLSPTINWKTMAVQAFTLPPLEEQRKLVALLSAQVDLIEAKREVLLELDRCLKASRDQILACGISGGKPTPTGLPDGWNIQPLNALVEFLDHRRIPIKAADRAKRQGKYPYYGASGIIDSIDDFIFDEDIILVGEDGANIVDRSSPLAFKVSGKVWVNNHAHVLKVLAPNNIDFLVDYLESITYKPYVTGTAQPKLNKAALGSIPIPVPPAEEQGMIASVYSRFQKGRDALLSNLEALNALHRKSLRIAVGCDDV